MLADLKRVTEDKLVRFKTLMNKKQTLYSEMLKNARVLVDFHDQMIINEQTKLQLFEEIDMNAIELVQKRQ